MKILVLGVTGMLGSMVFKQFFKDTKYQVWGTLRSNKALLHFPKPAHQNLLSNIDVLNDDVLVSVLGQVKPDVVINCIGLIKQLAEANDPLVALPINAMMPHRLAKLCALAKTRLIHISTDCVFSGAQGMYTENDISDAEDLYGKSKYMGELHDYPHAVTLRTSIIGHELETKMSLVDWFLSQTGEVKGYKKAIFSGLSTVELAKVIKDVVIPNRDIRGLYHVSVEPIDKYSLLHLIAEVYDKEIKIIADEKIQIDRSLNSSKFRQATAYTAPNWRDLIVAMHQTDKELRQHV